MQVVLDGIWEAVVIMMKDEINKDNNITDDFELQFIGLGQHVILENPPAQQDVKNIINEMKKLFKEKKPGEPLPPKLKFDQNNKWLIGMEFTLLDFINISAVFNDPKLYGILIALNGEKADILDGFKFEMRYEKLSDSLGGYKGKLTIPHEMQRLEFGTFTVILPECYLEIYNNGDFKIDVGFPTDLDFSRSMRIEAFPYLGSGGFYLARLSPGTSKSHIPQIDKFNPIIEFGVGMELGVGKSIDKGILKAGLSLTFLGVLEGILAFYKPIEGVRYYRLEGAFGVAGKLYGEVDFSIISARVEALVQAVASVTLKAYKAIPIVVEVKVSARAEVKVKFGPLKVKISKSFNQNIKADFLIGKDSCAPWDPCSQRLIPMSNHVAEKMKWQPLRMDGKPKRNLNLYFMPHLTVEGERKQDTGDIERRAKYCAMMYIESPEDDSGSIDTPFKALIEAILIWTINAYVNRNSEGTTLEDAHNSDVDIEVLCIIYEFLTGSKSKPKTNIVYRDTDNNNDIFSFLSNYFDISVCYFDPNATLQEHSTQGSFFPMIPDLKFIAEHNSTIKHCVDFQSMDNHRGANSEYLEYVKENIKKISVAYQNKVEQDYDEKKSDLINEDLSLATLVFQDCFTMIAKAMIQSAIETMEAKAVDCDETPIKAHKLLECTLTGKTVCNVSAMVSRYMLHGMRAPKPNDTGSLTTEPTFPLFELVGQQFTIDPLAPDDTLILKLMKSGDLDVKFKECSSPEEKEEISINIPKYEIERINRLKEIEKLHLGKAKCLKTYNEVVQTYSLKKPINWNDDRKIWFFSEPLLKALKNKPEISNALRLKKIKKGSSCSEEVKLESYNLATKIEVDIRKVEVKPGYINLEVKPGYINLLEDIYYKDIIGADEIGKIYLERIIGALNSGDIECEKGIDSIQLLYSPAGKEELGSEDGVNTEIIRTNLSKETNPSISFRVDCDNKKFIYRLFQGSLVRSGGYYLDYSGDLLKNISETDKISIIIKYKEKSHLKDYMNCLVSNNGTFNIDSKEETLFFEYTKSKVKVPAFPPGHVGFELDYEDPEFNEHYAEDEDKIYLGQQFNLIGFTVKSNSWFAEEAQDILPIGATNKDQNVCKSSYNPDMADQWSYQAVVPIAKSAHLNADLVDEDCFDPYAGLGGCAELELKPQDMFGNRFINLSDNTVSVPILYRDFLIPIHQWPGTKVEYEFSENGGIHLNINFTFDPSNYQLENCEKELEKCEAECTRNPYRSECIKKCEEKHKECIEKVKENANIDKEVYCRVYNQLKQDDVCISYSSSMILDNGEELKVDLEPDEKKELIDYVKKIYDLLKEAASNPTTRLDEVPSFPINKTINLSNPNTIFELRTKLIIERTEESNIDCDLQDVEAVCSAVTNVLPKAIKKDFDNQPTHSLYDFAASFEQIFEGNKIALGVSKEIVENQGDNKRIWVVRLNQDNYRFSKNTYFFAPMPLSTTKNTYVDVPISLYKPSEEESSCEVIPPCKKSFENIDLNQWARDCLTYVDNILEPKYAIPAYNNDTLDGILEVKESIAKAIAKTVTHIGVFKDGSSDLSNVLKAREKLEQQLLIRLSNAYDIDSIVQHSVDTESSDQIKKPMRLYGTIGADSNFGLVDNEKRDEYSFSTAKLPLHDEKTWLTYLFSSKQDDKYQKYKFEDLRYQISHIEHEIRDVPGIKGYQASSWLAFIIPWDPKIINKSLEIPVPLRYYPIPPELEGHKWVYNPVESIPLVNTRRWDYEYTYSQQLEPQDTIKTVVELNVKKEETGFTSKLDKLAMALAQFNYVFPAIKEDLDNKLREGTPDDVEHPFLCFVKYAKAVADAWMGWADEANKLDFDTASQCQMKLLYDIIEEKDNLTKEFRIRVVPKGACSYVPWITIKGYETEEVQIGLYKFYKCLDNDQDEGESCSHKEYLLYENRRNELTRTISLRGFDILNIQHAWAGVYLTRNERLFTGSDESVYKSTNEKFIFKTPFVKFASQMTPLLINEEYIDIAALSREPMERSLKDHLMTMMNELLDGRISKDHFIKGLVRYGFDLLDDELSLYHIKVPTYQALPFDFKNKDKNEVIEELSFKILELFDRPNGPCSSVGRLILQVGVYESIDNELPILELKNLYLEVDKIKELKGL